MSRTIQIDRDSMLSMQRAFHANMNPAVVSVVMKLPVGLVLTLRDNIDKLLEEYPNEQTFTCKE